MDDELDTSEIEERIRRAVYADAAAARRIAAAALNAPRLAPPMRARRTILVAAAVAIVVAATVAGWRGRSVLPPPSARSLSLRGSGSTIVVDGDDGRRWIVRSSDQERPQGGYVIVFPQ